MDQTIVVRRTLATISNLIWKGPGPANEQNFLCELQSLVPFLPLFDSKGTLSA